MAIEKGDIVKLEYTAYVKSNGQVVDTTDEEEAKKAGIHDPKSRYGPAVISVGAGEVLAGVDEMLASMSEGEEKRFEVPPEKAFGLKDDANVRIIPLKKFRDADMNPVPGQVVNIDNHPATIKAVNSGRVVVDFNHPMAGVALEYRVKVLKDAKTLEEKAILLAEKYDMKCSVNEDGSGAVSIGLEKAKYDERAARSSSAVALVARELKKAGAKKVSFSGEWDLS